MDFSIRVDPEHFDYLHLQKGSLDKFSVTGSGRIALNKQWQQAYEQDLRDTFEMIRPDLPGVCQSMLDVGSGLGGIDVLIRRYYEQHGGAPYVHLLDGVDDLPVMTLHAKTFNNMRIARNFQVKNGLSPLKMRGYGPDVTYFDSPFDLIVSFGSWCFHYPPMAYLAPIVASGCHPGTTLILDVRRGRPDYMRELAKGLDLVATIATRDKWLRCVFKPKAHAR